MGWPWSKTYVVRCPGGSKRWVIRDLDKAFPLYFRSAKRSFGMRADAVAGVTAGLNASSADTIHGLLEKMDEKGTLLIYQFRMAYTVFQADPCNNLDHLKERADRIGEQYEKLLQLDRRIEGFIELARARPDDATGLMERYREIVTGVQAELPDLAREVPALSRQMAASSIREAREQAHQWIAPGADDRGGRSW